MLRLCCLWHVYGVLIIMFEGLPICIVDIEVAHSPADVPTGWNDKAALGLSIGAYYDYRDGLVHWFDRSVLAETVRSWVLDEVLLVSFNGIHFDFGVLAAVLFDAGDGALADDLTTLAANSYDILAEVWHITGRDYAKGNSLDALCQVNNLGRKTGHGAHALRLWQEGRIAEVLNYCQNDVMLTKKLFELVAAQRGVLKRSAGPVRIRYIENVQGVPMMVVPEKQSPREQSA